MFKYFIFLLYAIVLYSSDYAQVNDTTNRIFPDSNSLISDSLTTVSYRRQQVLIKELEKTVKLYQDDFRSY